MDSLTEREQEIIRHILDGLSNHQIALEMSLAYNTIKWYTKRIYEKLSVHNRAQLIRVVNQLNITLSASEAVSKVSNIGLPVYLNQFVGRQQEILEISTLLAKRRLITLFGPGGVGKTRLATEIAKKIAIDHIVFVSLETVTSIDDFLLSVASALGIKLKIEYSLLEAFILELPEMPTLLILDNFETMLAAAPILPQILKQAPQLRILVTSRVVLNLQIEQIYEVTGLSVPADNSHASATQLFHKRATYLRPNFDLEQNFHIVAEICKYVDGIPLAIELSASWLRSLSCDEILDELKNDIAILQADLPDLNTRHQSILSVCQQSWEMLVESEKNVFMALAILQGDFSRQAGQTLSDASLDVLARLVDKAMLHMNNQGRYQIHSILRTFALTHLRQNYPQREQELRTGHAEFFMNLLIDLEQILRSENQATALNIINMELDNILHAWQYMAEHGSSEILAKGLTPLSRFLEITDRTRQGVEIFSKTLLHISPQTALYAGLLLFRGGHQIWLGRTAEATQEMFQALIILEDLNLEGVWSMPISMISFHEGYDHATRKKLEIRYQHDLRIYLERQQFWDAGWIEYAMGNITRAKGDYQESYHYLLSSLAHFRTIGDVWCMSWALDALSTTLIRMGKYAEAQETAQEIYQLSEKISNHAGLVISLELLGQIAHIQGEAAEAYRYYVEGLHYALINTTSTTIIAPLLQIALLIAEYRFLPLSVAIEALAIVQYHPSSQVGWFSFRSDIAEEKLNILRDDVEEAEYESAVQRGQSADLLTATRYLLDNFLTVSIPKNKTNEKWNFPVN